MSTADREIRAVANLPRRERAPGFAVAQLHPEVVGGGMNPILQIDAFALAQPVFKPHPHAGFSAVTYILPESPIGFINRDSFGDRTRIAPGALHWTAAGRGILHEEVPEVLGTAALGLQIFVDLPQSLRWMEPQRLHLDAQRIPGHSHDGVELRIVVGESNGLRSPLTPPTPGVRLIDVTLASGAVFEQGLDPAENAFLYLLGGAARAGSNAVQLVAFDLATTTSGTRLRIHAGEGGARLVLLGGIVLDQPVVSGGPFVFSSDADLARAVSDYQAGRMGRLAASRYDARGLPVVPHAG